MKKWRKHVINIKQYKSRHGTGRVFANYEETIQLIEAARIFIQHKEVVALSSVATESIINFEKDNWAYFPKNLSQKELLEPIITLDKFFKSIVASQYKDIFHEWLRLALSYRSAGETLTAREVVIPYENLRKLYSALWLVHKRWTQV